MTRLTAQDFDVAAVGYLKTRADGNGKIGTQHGFNNDTTPRFDEASAKLAWDRTRAFFKQTLGA